jgi:hypothetical protein
MAKPPLFLIKFYLSKMAALQLLAENNSAQQILAVFSNSNE